MKIIAIANQKGGVGKTTIAFNLSKIFSVRHGDKVIIIDNDPQGNLTSSFLESQEKLKGNIINAYEGVDLVPQKITDKLYLLGTDIRLAAVAERDFQVIFRLKEALLKMKQSHNFTAYDFALIDGLPSFGHLHLATLTAADYIIIPVKPAPYALAGLKDLFDTIDRVKKYFNPHLRVLGIVLNQVDGRKLVLEREMEEALKETYGSLVFKTKISKRIKIEESPVFQKGVNEYAPKSPSTKEFECLAKEIVQRIKLVEHELPSFKAFRSK